MEKFSKEFYASRIEDWITKYIKVKELCKLIKSIEKDIQKNGGQIVHISERKSISFFDEVRRSTLSTPLDRHSVGLGVLEGTEGLFNQNEKIFHTPLMYEINETFKEIENLDFCDDMKIFLYFLTIEVHNVYVFYLSIEKNIFTRINKHSYSRQKYSKMNKDELLEELSDLTDITYLMYSFYSYIDLNIEAVHEILKYFDDHFQILNDDISMNKLFFRKYLSKKESDLKYILNFKIIIESSALIESYYHEILKLNNSKEIKEQVKELKEVLSYLNEKNTDRVNDDIYEVYLKQKKTHYNEIIKNKKNYKIDIQNSFFIDVHQQEDYYKRLGEKQYDEEINIKTTRKNINNLILLYLHTFIYSLYYILPYLSFYFYYIQNDIEFYYLGFVLTSTHVGNFISKIIVNFSENYKLRFIFFCICFIFSFSLTVISEIFLHKEKKDIKMYIILNLVSRFIYGFSCGRLMTRKYIMLFLPESEIKYYSLVYIIIIYFGILCGVLLNFLTENKERITIKIKNDLIINIENYLILFSIGIIIAIIYIVLILFFFTEPTKGSMLNQNRITISTKDETSKDSIENEYKEFKDIEKDNKDEKDEIEKYNKDNNSFKSYKMNAYRESTIKSKIKHVIKDNESDKSGSNSLKELENKTYIENNKLDINRISSTKPSKCIEEYDKEERISDPLNISGLKNRESTNIINILNNNINELNNININNENKENKLIDKYNLYSNKISKNSLGDELMSAEEIKGLNSIEKNIINMNTKNNYDDINLLPEELDRIRNSQLKKNRSYLCSFLVFIVSLLLTNSLNEFIILSAPLCFIQYNEKYYEGNEGVSPLSISENLVILSISLLLLFSFPFIIFFRMMKTFNIERRLLLTLYLFLYIFLIFCSIMKYLSLSKYSEDITSIANISYKLSLLIIFIFSNLIEGATHLLSYKLIPSFVKICKINNKYLLSYSTVIGKTIGGLIYCALCLMDDNLGGRKGNDENSPFSKTNVFKNSVYIFCCITIIDFFILCICYRSLRVRAISKLFYIND